MKITLHTFINKHKLFLVLFFVVFFFTLIFFLQNRIEIISSFSNNREGKNSSFKQKSNLDLDSHKTIFLLPHQDDEMFLAGAIKRNIDNKKEVYVVMVTDGGVSQVKKIINEKIKKGKLNGKFLPLNRKLFAAARNKEFFDSMRILGVHENHIIFANPGGIEASENPLYKDGELSEKLVKKLLVKYYKKFGNAAYYTVAGESSSKKHRGHADHVALYNALHRFSLISEKHFYSEVTSIGVPHALSNEEKNIKKKALRSYSVWDPENGRFAIGEHSVKNLLQIWKENGIEYEIK